MPSNREYAPRTRRDYYQLTQFDPPCMLHKNYQSLLDFEQSQGKINITKVQIKRNLAEKIYNYIERDGIGTRGCAPKKSHKGEEYLTQTLDTVKFSIHYIAGTGGGWYILESGGREPAIRNEFIEYGSRKKSGGRKSRYRRNLSYSEQKEVDHLNIITPDLNKLYMWILKKYPQDVEKVEYRSVNSAKNWLFNLSAFPSDHK